jgi:hypothetical protein
MEITQELGEVEKDIERTEEEWSDKEPLAIDDDRKAM